jgi:hypothetical protein
MAKFKQPSGVSIYRLPDFGNSRTINEAGQALSFKASRAVIREARKTFINAPTAQEDEPRGYSRYFGTPLYDYVSIIGGEYTDLDGNRISYAGGIGNEFHIENVILEVRRNKKIVHNKLTGRDGSLKEFISGEDYLVTVNGLLAGEGNKFPYEEVAELVNILNADTALEVESEYLGLFLDEDYDLVVQDYRMPQRRGFRNLQPFTINLVSDRPVNLNEIDVGDVQSNIFFA